MRKIRILAVPSDLKGGCSFFRIFQPLQYIESHYGDEFDITYNLNPDWKNLSYLKSFDVIHVYKGLFDDMKSFYNSIVSLKKTNTVTVLDVDDAWELTDDHPNYRVYTEGHLTDMIDTNAHVFDYVTTTTSIFAKYIFLKNHHVTVIPNAIDPEDDRFKINRKPYDKLRVGFIMGSQHEKDVDIMGNFTSELSSDTLDKIQLVLCGFDLNGIMNIFDKSGKYVNSRPMLPTETVWHRYESKITNNRKILSDDYDKFLNMYVPDFEYPDIDNEHYRRCWTKDIDHYFKHYESVDVLLAPLKDNHFNNVKSPLKVAECCFSNTALIASNIGPYKEVLTNAVEASEKINKNGTALLVNNRKDWAKYITMLANDRNLVSMLQKNIHDAFKDVYSLESISKIRRDFYREITNYRN